MKITDLKCAVIGQNPVVRIVTDEGISGYGEIESPKSYLKFQVLFFRQFLLGEDPTDVERVMLRIRRLGSFKPWGSAVSAIEIALWDIAGKSAGLPIYKLLGGKIRDRVRVYNGAVRFPLAGQSPADYAENVARMKAAREGFSLIKQGIGYHSQMLTETSFFRYDEPRAGAPYANRGPLTERGLKHVIACVEAMKEVLGDAIGLALDCGPGWTVSDAIRLARALEPLNIAEHLFSLQGIPLNLALGTDLQRSDDRDTDTCARQAMRPAGLSPASARGSPRPKRGEEPGRAIHRARKRTTWPLADEFRGKSNRRDALFPAGRNPRIAQNP